MTGRPDLVALDKRHLWHPFTQAKTAPDPIVIVGGKGAKLIAADGREYLDLVSSWWVNMHGLRSSPLSPNRRPGSSM